ncbi:gamma-glutamyltransferase [Rhodobacteraceae bacterium N5(2021)]|uniref:Glutathione hydrolase proenzyme n=1 Tax=Gymnodinialimonas phycosphaerae TaxID=2841589 RepID=A0A975YH96_9RHOB|nr:gamma-glutamyltransferase [Gymnodinialimonas phycosphaerae]MBY4892478.1 gamma-glutamyltransferase [Gymnodinialimonas phycosphaerae]
MRPTLPLILVAIAFATPALTQQAADTVAPETGTQTVPYALSDRASAAMAARDAGDPVVAQDWMVVAANPLAVEAGADVLAAGGTAADAMVAVQAVLGLVEPQSSGLGGGAFLVWYDAQNGALTTLDGRETAPLAATPRLFQTEDGEPMGFWDAVVGGLSVGTPGTPALMEDAHRRWGRANWGALLDPAITLAEGGFQVSPRMAASIAGDAERLSTFPATAAYFLPGGVPLAEGSTLMNPAYAATLRAMQADGADAIYEGEIAEGIIDTVRHAEGNPGVLSMRDLAVYEVIERPAVCAEYSDMDVCGMGPPSSGALTVGQILGMASAYDLGGPDDLNAWRIIGDASRLAFADRGRYMADSDYVPMPTEGLVDPAYLAERAALLDTDMALEDIAPGTPTWDHAQLWADDQSLEFPSTSHISIVDSYGNVLSMTTTIENGFGSRLMTPGGFLLNNELTDFSFRTHADGVPIANRLEPGKRPRSSMSPTIVMRDGEPILAIGSPGGSRIIGYVATAIIAHYDWGLDIQDAIALPHAVNRFGTFDVEEGTEAEALAEGLEALGYEVSIRGLNSGLHAIAITEGGLQGGADPRREGIALGQ